jgi:tRNA(Ile)-lysidine synthase
MLFEFEKKVADFIKANGLFISAAKVLLAVSGGADSTALLYALLALKTGNVLNAELLCAHINHQLRAVEADSDEDFVTAQAAELKLALTTKRVDVRGFAHRNKLSIETAARELRIKALLDIAEASNCICIATAHQKNDNAETILQRLVRGTGFRGLGGIWPRRIFAGEIRFVRPLLCVGRDEIIEYLQQRNLKWRQDHTNADCTYRRNYIRHRLLPSLQGDCTNSVVNQLYQLSQSARRFYRLVCTRADAIWPELADCADEKIALGLKMFLNQPKPVKIELVRRSLTTIGCGERDLTQRHYERILQLSGQNITGGKVNLPGGFVVRREYWNLIFTNQENKACLDEQIGESVRLQIPGQTRFGRYLIETETFETESAEFEEFVAEKTSCVEWFDLEKLKLPLVVRFRQAGDRFVPLGLAREKKLGKFLTAQRVPHHVRRKALIISDSENIIWVWPIRISEQAKITEETRKILQLQITDSEPVR